MSRHSFGDVSIRLVFLVILSWSYSIQAAEHPSDRPIDGAVIYDHDPATQLGDDVFGDVICNMEKDAPGRCSHGGPVCMQYPDGSIVAFHTNASDHNLDGWSEYAVSKDGARPGRNTTSAATPTTPTKRTRNARHGWKKALSLRTEPGCCSSPILKKTKGSEASS